MYQFSAPMPYNKEDIDKLLTINNQVEKCEITSLYASLPSNCTLFTGFEQARNIQSGKQNFDYWKNLFSYTLENNLDFIYLLNSPIPFDLNNDDFEKMLDKLDKLLNELSNMGIKKIRVANPQLISYLWKNYNKFDIFASTSLEYKHISEYQNLILMHPEIKQIVPSHDINK
ncbi:hypothetical protein IJ818_08020, partial [bacterium]|nr:hypothetical protein [bacterium]